MSKIKEGTSYKIEAENGKGLQEYEYDDGSKVKTGTIIGKEVYRNGEWKLELKNGIYFSNTPDENEDNED